MERRHLLELNTSDLGMALELPVWGPELGMGMELKLKVLGPHHVNASDAKRSFHEELRRFSQDLLQTEKKSLIQNTKLQKLIRY